MKFQSLFFLQQYSSAFLALVFLAVAPLLGGLLEGLRRLIVARAHKQYGPSVFQPFYDFLKLIVKRQPCCNKDGMVFAMLCLIFNALSLVLLLLKKDLLLAVFTLLGGTCFLIFGSVAVGLTEISIGERKELLACFIAETVLISTALGFYLVVGSFSLSEAMNQTKMLIIDLPLLFAVLIAFLAVKLQIRSVETAFSGPALAVIMLADWVRTVSLLVFVGLFFLPNLPLAVLIAVLIYLSIAGFCCEANQNLWNKLIRWNLSIGIFLCLINLAWLYIKFGS